MAKRFSVLSSLLLLAGCASDDREGRYSETSNYYGGIPSASATTSGSQSYSSQGTPTTAGTSTSSTTTQFQGQSESDRTLVTQVRQSLNQDATLAAITPQVQVTAQSGTVTLSGNVSSEQEKQRIESKVKSTSGVVSVNNQLQVSVSPTSDRPASRLYQESPTQPGDRPQPDATTSDPAKTDTTGPQSTSTADTSATRTPAGPSDTSTSPSTSSTTASQTQPSSDLSATSRPEASSRIYSSGTASSATLETKVQGLTEADRSLGQKVMHELSTDAALSAQLPTVRMTIDSGKVTLHGTAKSEEQKLAIETAVEKIAGVTSVDNQLQVSATGATSTTPATTPGSTSDTAPQK